MPHRVLIVALALLAAVVPLAADGIDDAVRAAMATQHVPGLSLAVCGPEGVVRAAGYGFANLEHQVPAVPGTVYQSGSLGKMFTAAGILLLAEDGRLGLDDPLTRHFPDAPRAWRKITLRHLLHHTSGLRDYTETDLDLRRDYTEDELLELAFRLPHDFPPGAQWSYSNTGYMLLGIVIGRVAGRHWSDFLSERIFAPLGMASTQVISEAELVPHRAAGYVLDESGAWRNQDWVAPSLNTLADGALYFTVLDLCRWDAALYQPDLLSAQSLAAWWTPAPLADGTTYPYGFGWNLAEQRGEILLDHGGGWQGFSSRIARYPGRGRSIVVLTNLAGADLGAITREIAGLVDPALRLPNPRAPQPDPDPDRTARLRELLAAWGDGRPSQSMAPALRAAHATTVLDASSRRRLAAWLAAGASFSYLAEDDLEAAPVTWRGETVTRILHYGLVSADEAVRYRFYLTSSGLVAGFWRE